MFGRLWQKLKDLWALAKSERASPREIFWAVFIGAFAGSTPAVGVHGGLALGLATLFRKNRLFAWLGSRISNMVFLPFIAFTEVQLSHRLRTGGWAAMTVDREHALEQARDFLIDWCLGTIPVGVVLGLLVGGGAWIWAVRRDRKRKRDEAEAAAAAKPTDAPPAEAA